MNSLTYESVSGRKGGLVSIACASSRSEILAYRPDGICKLCLTLVDLNLALHTYLVRWRNIYLIFDAVTTHT